MYAVLLESCSQLPFIVLATEVAEIVGAHRQDALIQLRKQQGIVWEFLEHEKAEKLGALLIANGYPAGLVEQDDVVRIHKPILCSNGDPVEGGFELEDIFSDKRLVRSVSIEYLQAGWVREEVEVDRRRIQSSSSVRAGYMFGTRDKTTRYTTRGETESYGWVLNIFQYSKPVEWLRIIGRSFNYDYQSLSGAFWKQRFGLLLADLARVAPYASLNEGFKATMGSDGSSHDSCEFETLEDMENRARWELTMRKLEM